MLYSDLCGINFEELEGGGREGENKETHESSKSLPVCCLCIFIPNQ